MSGEVGGSFGVERSLHHMRTAIELHDHLVLYATEVGDEGTDWLLPSELRMFDSASAEARP